MQPLHPDADAYLLQAVPCSGGRSSPGAALRNLHSPLDQRPARITRRTTLPNVRFGSLADITTRPRHVRFTPDSGHSADELACPFCAISGHPGMGHACRITSLGRLFADAHLLVDLVLEGALLAGYPTPITFRVNPRASVCARSSRLDAGQRRRRVAGMPLAGSSVICGLMPITASGSRVN